MIGTRWFFQIKSKPNGFIAQYKSRLAGKGFSQKAGSDLGDIYALVMRYSTLRLALALSEQRRMNILQVNFNSTFLNGELQEELQSARPEGFPTEGQERKAMRL